MTTAKTLEISLLQQIMVHEIHTTIDSNVSVRDFTLWTVSES